MKSLFIYFTFFFIIGINEFLTAPLVYCIANSMVLLIFLVSGQFIYALMNTAPKNTVTGDKFIRFPDFCQNMILYFTTVQRFIDELYLCVVGEQKSRPMGKVTKESLLLVTLWVAMVTMYQGANSLTRSIEGVCDVVFTCVFLESLRLLVYDS